MSRQYSLSVFSSPVNGERSNETACVVYLSLQGLFEKVKQYRLQHEKSNAISVDERTKLEEQVFRPAMKVFAIKADAIEHLTRQGKVSCHNRRVIGSR